MISIQILVHVRRVRSLVLVVAWSIFRRSKWKGGAKETQIARLALLIPPKSTTALVVPPFRLTFKLGLARA